MELIVLFILWIMSGLLIVFERRLYRIIVYFGIFSLISSLVYLFLSAPDLAMVEAGIAVFVTVFFIIFINKYYRSHSNVERDLKDKGKLIVRIGRIFIPMCFIAGLFALFVYLMPETVGHVYLKERYLMTFMSDVGGENAVTAVLLAYKVYNTLFEALALIIAVVAVLHMSHFEKDSIEDGRHSKMENYGVAVFPLRIICPIIVLFGAYLAVNGHISAGGGFQGGIVVATFFICRYLVYNIYDISVRKVMILEEMIFVSIIVLSVLAIFWGVTSYLPSAYLSYFQSGYLILMNIFIGLKVACAFFILFYRYIAIESR